MHPQTLTVEETVLGMENPETLGSMNNLAFIPSDQGKQKEAKQRH